MNEHLDLMTARAEEYARSFESMREMEWRVVFETYAGYTAIAVAFNYVHEHYPRTLYVGRLFTLAPLLLLLVSSYFFMRVQERLHNLRKMQNEYLKTLHIVLRVEKIEDRPLRSPRVRWWQVASWFREHNPPIHRKWYAYSVQLMISIAICFGLTVYIVASTRSGDGDERAGCSTSHIVELMWSIHEPQVPKPEASLRAISSGFAE